MVRAQVQLRRGVGRAHVPVRQEQDGRQTAAAGVDAGRGEDISWQLYWQDIAQSFCFLM